MRNKFPFEYDHSVGSNLDYSFNWIQDSWLAVGETILTSSWTPLESGVTITNEQNVNGITSAFISVATAGAIFKIVNTITTSEGRIDSRTLILSCKQR